jgi:uncharacterized protein (DUF2267 family)
MAELRKYATPEAAHLAEQERLLAKLVDQLATKETEFATTGAEFDRFRLHYMRRFAPLYAELDRLEAEIAGRAAIREGTVEANARATEAVSRAEESSEALGTARDSASGLADGDDLRASPPPELRGLYRDAAKMIHPDLAADDEERDRRTALMAALNAAYATGDAETIARIIDGEAARPEAIVGDDVASRLVRVIRKLAQVRSRLAELEQMNEALQADPLFVLFAQCRDPWQSGQDPLAEDEASLRARIAGAQAQLAALVMADAKPSHPAQR